MGIVATRADRRSLWGARIGLLVLVLLTLGLAGGAEAAKKKYTYEEDPVRLGNKALDEGKLDVAKERFDEAIANEYEAYKAQYGLAEILVRQGAFADAEPLYREALSGRKATGSSDFPEAHAGLGLLLLRLGRAPEAKLEFEQALKEKAGLWEATYGQGRLAFDAGDVDAAKKLFSKGSGRKGLADGEDKYHYGMAIVALAKNDIPTAEKEAILALTLNPADSDYGAKVAEIYTKRGAPTLAIDAYEKALATPGMVPTAPTLYSLGTLYQQVQRWNDAKARYESAVGIDSTFAPGWKALGYLYQLARTPDRAAAAYLRYVQLEKNDVAGYLGLAQACLKIKRNKQALEAAQVAFGLDSLNTDVRLAFARAASYDKDAGLKRRALAVYASVEDTLKFECDDWTRLGTLRQDAGETFTAQRLFKRAVSCDSLQIDAYLALGGIALKAAHADSAAIWYQKAVNLSPTNANALLNLGTSQASLKQWGPAIHNLREAVKNAPDYVPGKLSLAQTLISADSLAAAETLYQEVLSTDPTNARANRFLGFIYLKQQKWAAAIPVLEAATQADPNSPDGWAFLAQAYLGTQQFDKARAAVRKCLELKPDHPFGKSIQDVLKKQAAAPPAKK